MKPGRVIEPGRPPIDPKNFWAVSIRSDCVFMARLDRRDDGAYELRDFFCEPYHVVPQISLPYSGNSEAGKAMRLAQAEALKNLFEKINVADRDVVFSMPGIAVFSRFLVLPPVPMDKVKDVVEEKIHQQVPFGLDELCFDYQILGRKENENGSYQVLMAVVKKDVLHQYLEVFEGLNCRIHSVNLDVFAAYNWLEILGKIGGSQGSIALVDIDHYRAEVICETDGLPSFTRPIAIKDEVGQLANEIGRSFQYFRGLPGGNLIRRTVFIGGGSIGESSKILEAKDYLEKTFKMEVVEINDVAKELASKHPLATGSDLTPVLGLALGCHQDVVLDINLTVNSAYERKTV